MQVVVKKPHIKITGGVTPDLLDFLKNKYSGVKVIEDKDDELIEVTKSDWYKKVKSQLTPGSNMKFYRKMHKLTQEELGEKLGGISRQNVYSIARGTRPISKKTAIQLAKLFKVSVEKFISEAY